MKWQKKTQHILNSNQKHRKKHLIFHFLLFWLLSRRVSQIVWQFFAKFLVNVSRAAPLCSGNEVDVLVMRENLQDLQKNKNFSSFSSVKLDRPKNIVTPEKWQNFHGKFISLSAACLVVLCTSAEHLQSRRAGSILFRFAGTSLSQRAPTNDFSWTCLLD